MHYFFNSWDAPFASLKYHEHIISTRNSSIILQWITSDRVKIQKPLRANLGSLSHEISGKVCSICPSIQVQSFSVSFFNTLKEDPKDKKRKVERKLSDYTKQIHSTMPGIFYLLSTLKITAYRHYSMHKRKMEDSRLEQFITLHRQI